MSSSVLRPAGAMRVQGSTATRQRGGATSPASATSSLTCGTVMAATGWPEKVIDGQFGMAFTAAKARLQIDDDVGHALAGECVQDIQQQPAEPCREKGLCEEGSGIVVFFSGREPRIASPSLASKSLRRLVRC